MDSALKMADIIISLDMKTSADQWKLYGKLYAKHVADLKSSIDIAEPITLLISNFEQILGVLTISQGSATEKQLVKLLKIANFLLKLIIKFCELSECNFRQGWREVLRLLMLLNSCSRCHNITEKFGEDLRRYIVVGATPLLAVLTKEEEFFKAFISEKNAQEELTEAQRVGLLFLSLSLMKQVVERKIPATWNSAPFVEIVLNTYDSCGLLIDLNSRFEGNDAYSSLVSICTSFMVATVGEASVPELENALMLKLFQGGLHTALLVSDLFCLIGRLTSDEYCLHLTTYLCEVLKSRPRLSNDRIEHIVIGSLVRRLWCLLSHKSRDSLHSKYSSPEAIHVCYWFEGSSSYSDFVTERFLSFHGNPTSDYYVNMLAAPPYIGQSQDGCPNLDALISHTLRIIHYLGSSKRDGDNDPTWCYKLLLVSLKLILNYASAVSPDQVTQIFEQLSTLAENCNNSGLFVVSYFLSKSTNVLLRIPPSPRLTRAVSVLLVKCMGTEDKVMEASTFQVLETLEQSPGHKEIVTMASSHSERLLDVINSHRHTTPPPVTHSLVEVMTSMLEPVHSCRRKSSKPNDVDCFPPAKKARPDPSSDASAASIQRLVSETKILKGLIQRTRLSNELKQQLSSVRDELSYICADSY